MFTRVISTCLNVPFIIMWCPFLSFIIAFVLKSIFSDVSIATPAFFFFNFHLHEYLFHPFTFCLFASFLLRWVSCRQHIYGSYFLIHSANLCFLTGAFNSFTFIVIIDRYALLLSWTTAKSPYVSTLVLGQSFYLKFPEETFKLIKPIMTLP